MSNRCLGCHIKLEKKYLFCSITCACLCGFYSVIKGQLKNINNITQEEKDKFLNNHPLRERGRKYL